MNITNTENTQFSSTPYDDVFRTLMNDCIQLLIPVINEVFGKHYSGDTSEDKYILECQSTNNATMLIRIFEYITQEALDSGKLERYKLTVTIPNAAVLFLRSNRNTPDVMNILINTPGGSVSFDVPVLQVKSYSLAQLFEKNFYSYCLSIFLTLKRTSLYTIQTKTLYRS